MNALILTPKGVVKVVYNNPVLLLLFAPNEAPNGGSQAGANLSLNAAVGSFTCITQYSGP